MIGNRKRWQFPVKNSKLNNQKWIHCNAKFHYFTDKNKSLCGKYTQVWYVFETYPTENDWHTLSDDMYCQKCLKILKELRDRG